MREVLDQWDFVLAAYALGVGGTLVTLVWSWLAMVGAEAKRQAGREQ
jgi:hypothetical protein